MHAGNKMLGTLREFEGASSYVISEPPGEGRGK